MKLSGAAFNRMLNQMGQSFQWRRGYACPCINKNSGQAKTNCAHCSGKGRLWGEAVEGSAGTVSQSKMRQYATFGVWDQDDVMLSIPSNSPLYGIGQFDRVEALNRTEPFSINFVRGLNDAIRFRVVSLERAFYLDANEQIVECPLPTVNPDGSLTWGAGAPPPQATFSLTGRRHPDYFCYLEIPTDRPMHFGEKLPRRVVLRRFDLFGRA